MDKHYNAISIEEKPKNPKSNYCVTGLYFYPKGVSEIAKTIKPSERGELEITTLNNVYLNQKRLHVTTLGRGYSWLDTGTHESLIDASSYIKMLEEHQGLKVCCPEEIAYKHGWINKETLLEQGHLMEKSIWSTFIKCRKRKDKILVRFSRQHIAHIAALCTMLAER